MKGLIYTNSKEISLQFSTVMGEIVILLWLLSDFKIWLKESGNYGNNERQRWQYALSHLSERGIQFEPF